MGALEVNIAPAVAAPARRRGNVALGIDQVPGIAQPRSIWRLRAPRIISPRIIATGDEYTGGTQEDEYEEDDEDMSGVAESGESSDDDAVDDAKKKAAQGEHEEEEERHGEETR